MGCVLTDLSSSLAALALPDLDPILRCGQFARCRAHVVHKPHALVDQGSDLAVLAEVIDKDCRAERDAALFRRHNPPATDIPNENVAAVFMSFDKYVG